MTRELRTVPPGPEVLVALRDALAGGPALLVADARPPGVPPRVPQRVALVVETSGSTGMPKRVALSADAVLASAAASESALGGPGQWVLALPTHYIAGLNVLARSISSGFEPVTVPDGTFTAVGFRHAAERLAEDVRWFTALVPAQLATLLGDDAAVEVLRRFARVLVGGQSTPGPLMERAHDLGVAVTRSYGSSETGGGCVYDGVPIGQTSVRAEDGEVWLGGPMLADGYLDDPLLTRERFVVADGARWFRTSDEGTWDGRRLRVTGRRDDVLISGGLKVSIGAIEAVLHEHAGLQDAVVVAAPDERWGQVPVAFTAGSTDPAADPDGHDHRDAIAAVARDLGVQARPARVIHLDALPLLPSGKVDRRALAALAAAAAD